MKNPKCYNCKHASEQFKVGKLTHLHCLDKKQYNQEGLDNDEFTAWDTLRTFSDTCSNHEFKQ